MKIYSIVNKTKYRLTSPSVCPSLETAEQVYKSLYDYYTKLHVVKVSVRDWHNKSFTNEIHHHIITLTDKDEFGDLKDFTVELAMFVHEL